MWPVASILDSTILEKSLKRRDLLQLPFKRMSQADR